MSDEQKTPEELVEQLLAILRSGGVPAESQANARAMMTAATTYLRESFGETEALDVLYSLSDAVKVGTVAQSSDQLADLVLQILRNRGKRPETHEDARAFIAGAACFLHEAYGAPYAGAVVAGIAAAAGHYDALQRCEPPEAGMH